MSSLLIGNLQCFFMFQGEEYITSAIFWAMSMSSLLIGNLQCFFMFQGEEYITSATRNTLGVILIVVSGLGTALMFGLRPPPSQSQDEAVNPTAAKEEVPSVLESLKS